MGSLPAVGAWRRRTTGPPGEAPGGGPVGLGAGASPWGVRGASLLGVVVGWELLARRLGSLLMPGPLDTIRTLARLLGGGELWSALGESNGAMLLGYALAAVVGVPLGLSLGLMPRWARAVDVYLDLLLVTPMPALIPLLVVWLDVGLLTRVLVVFVFAVTVIAVSAAAGVREVDRELVDMARAFGARRLRLWWTVVWPAALPATAGGLRLGLGRAINGMVAVELLAVAVGAGRLILRFQGDFDAAAVYAVALVVAAEGVLLTGLVRRLEPWLVPGQARGPAG